MSEGESCREMVSVLLDEVSANGWNPFITYAAAGHRIVGWTYAGASRTGRPVEVSFDEDSGVLRLALAPTGFMHRGFEQTWDNMRDLDAVREQLRASLGRCLSR